MRKNYYLFLVISLLGLWSCSNDNSSEPSIKANAIADKAYISPQMQQTLAILDTCKGAVPIEELIPYTKNENNSSYSSQSILTRGSEKDSTGSSVVTTYDNYYILYANQKTTISAVQAANLGVNAGTYYVTCYAVIYYLHFSTEVTHIEDQTGQYDTMGIDPDDLTKRGFAITNQTKKACTFTTYIWGCSTTNGGDIYSIIPIIPTASGGENQYPEQYTFMSCMHWRYYAE